MNVCKIINKILNCGQIRNEITNQSILNRRFCKMRVQEALVLFLVLSCLVPKQTECVIPLVVIAGGTVVLNEIRSTVIGIVVSEIWDEYGGKLGLKDTDPLNMTNNFMALNQKLENAEKSVSLINCDRIIAKCYMYDTY